MDTPVISDMTVSSGLTYHGNSSEGITTTSSTTSTSTTTTPEVGAVAIATPAAASTLDVNASGVVICDWIRSVRRMHSLRAALVPVAPTAVAYLLSHLAAEVEGGSDISQPSTTASSTATTTEAAFEALQALMGSVDFRRHLADLIAVLPRDPNTISSILTSSTSSVTSSSSNSGGSSGSGGGGGVIQPKDVGRYLSAAIMIARFPDHVLSGSNTLTESLPAIQSLAQECALSARLLLSRFIALLRCVSICSSTSTSTSATYNLELR